MRVRLTGTYIKSDPLSVPNTLFNFFEWNVSGTPPCINVLIIRNECYFFNGIFSNFTLTGVHVDK